MLLAYVDESFSQDWYYMAAMLCDGPGAQALSDALDAVVAKAVKDFQVTADAELHGYELFQGVDCWKGIPPRVRIGVYNEAFTAIGQHCFSIVLRGLNVARQRNRYGAPDPPHTVVLQHLLERVDECAMQHGEHVLVIADEVGEQSKHRANLRNYRTYGTGGYRGRKLTRIVDSLHFAPSAESRLVQAIDLVVFLYRRIQTHPETDERAVRANAKLWERIAPKIAHEHCWYP